MSHAELVNAVVSLLKEIPQRAIVPLDEIPDEADFDVGMGGVQWNSDGDSVFNQLCEVKITPVINKEFINEVFGHCGGVERRAMRLIARGHFDLSTIKFCKTNCRLDCVMIPCTMFQI